jgi:hypothetical protein
LKRFAVVGLVGFVAAGAHAQVVGPPAPAAPACAVSSKVGDQYIETPLAGLDPASPAPLPVLQANAGAVMVICGRPTIVPEIADYRVLTEMHLPLAIRSGGKTLFLGVKGGQIQFAIPDGDATPEEMSALRARRDQMQDAMAAKAGGK